ncbi:MAG TPA: hypothetical protein VHW24_25715 [Bryobacteraceae bacterium]|jgi:uncharacterized protein involved in exopolysaccharide biosynthesis|nr:hypothetical protein [Bryobacteraceae bacterium]
MALPQSFVSVSRRPPDIEDYIDMLRRYRSWIIGPMFLGLVCSTVIAFLWPDTFVSTAMMRISPQQVSERLVPAEFTAQMMDQINEMEQEILSRTTLEAIITDPSLNLYKREQGQKPMEDIVADMRKDIAIKAVSTSTSSNSDNRQLATAFSIAFTYQDRYKAQAVVRNLVSKFMDQNHQVRKKTAQLTANFLDSEVKQAQDRLTKLEEEIAKFKTENNGKLPEEVTSNSTMLNNLLMQQSQYRQQIQNAIDRKNLLDSNLNGQLNQLQYYKDNSEETLTPEQSAQVQVQNQELASATARVQGLTEQLAGVRQTLGAKNPEVRRIEAQIKAAQEHKDRLEKDQQQKDAATAAPNQTAGAPADKKIRNKNAEVQVINVQQQIDQTRTLIAEAEANIKALQNDRENINKQIAMYQGRIEAAPLNERRWGELNRDHLLAQQDYDEKVKKRQMADTAQNLEEHQAGASLELLDQPSDPQQPTEPKRAEWAAVGTGLGLLLGVVLAGAKEMKNTSLKNLKDVRAYTNLPVLSSIPLLENALLVRRKRRLFWLAWSGTFILGTLAVLISVYYYYSGQK